MTTNPSLNVPEAAPSPQKPRKVFRRIKVTRVKQLTPHMVRVTFTGDDLAAFAWNGPAAHIKLVFPEDGQTEPSMPDPDGPRLTRIRTYTPRRFDASVPELDVEFVLHGVGPASNWAAQAQEGQVLVVGGPGRNYEIDPAADWLLLVGDDTAIPAISSILDALPATMKAYVILEVADALEERELASPGQVEVTWLHRGSAQPDIILEQALRNFKLPAGDGRVYVGAEAGVMRRMRQYLLKDLGLEAGKIVTRGYWKDGATNYPDHDYGTD
jgi:NADPH-dependent ferric siderophore reductase